MAALEGRGKGGEWEKERINMRVGTGWRLAAGGGIRRERRKVVDRKKVRMVGKPRLAKKGKERWKKLAVKK